MRDSLFEQHPRNMNEYMRANPEMAFAAARESLIRRAENYQVPPWIEDNGVYLTPIEGSDKLRFNPDAYDPKKPEIPKGNVYILESNPEHLFEDPFDLDNLRIVDKEDVLKLHRRLEDLAHDPENERKSVVGMIGTGGTIAMTKNEDGELEPGLDIDYLLRNTAQGLPDKFAVASVDFPTLIDSSQMEVDYNAELIITTSYIWKNASPELKEKFGGFLVAHGTDTMAPSSAYYATMLGPNRPFSVGFVGSQKSTEEDGTDAYANIKIAFDVLKELKHNKKKEVFVAMGSHTGGAYPAVGVDKVSDQKASAFASPTHDMIYEAVDFGAKGLRTDFFDLYSFVNGDLGVFTPDTMRRALNDYSGMWERKAAVYGDYRKEFWPIILRGYSGVLNVRPQEGDDPGIFYNQVRDEDDVRFVTMTTFGSFTANNKIRKAVMAAAQETGKAVFVANPFPEGKIDHQYAVAAALRRSGAYPTAVPPIATAAKLFLAQAMYGQNIEAIADFITTRNYVGEQPPAYWKAFADTNPAANVGLLEKEFKILHQGKISQ